MLKNIIVFYFFPASLFESHNPKFYFIQYFNIKRKEIQKSLPQTWLCTHMWASASCWIVLDPCQMSRVKLRNGRTALSMAKSQGPGRSCDFHFKWCRQNNEEVPRACFIWCLSFPGGFCVVSLEAFTLAFFRNSAVVWDDYRQSPFPREETVFS